MRIVHLTSLSLAIPEQLSASAYGWIRRCPLRALYVHRANGSYYANGLPALMGSLVHAVREDFDGGRIRSHEEFLSSWSHHRERLSPGPGGAWLSYREYGLKKERLWQQFLLHVRRRDPERGTDRATVLAEHRLSDAGCYLSGRLDVLVLRGGVPLEVREYKTGQLYEKLAGENGRSAIREDYRLQLLLYGWLVYSHYGHLPRWMKLVDGAGRHLPIDFSLAEITALKEELVGLYGHIAAHLHDPGLLAIPDLSNCGGCAYRFGCPSAWQDITGELSGVVRSSRTSTYGSFELLLEDGRRLVYLRNDHDLVQAELDMMRGKRIIAGPVRRTVGSAEVHYLESYAVIRVMGH